MSQIGPVGMIGLGRLGLAVAARMLAAGYAVAGYRRGSLEAFEALGGTAVGDTAQVARCSGLVLLLLPEDDALGLVMEQIGPALRPGQVVVCLGTHRLAAKQAALAIAAAAGAALLDGEVSGTPEMLAAGRASIMLAGDAAAAERLGPLLACLSPAVTYLGPFGNATAMKLVTNYLVGVHTLAAAEALVMAGCLGLDPHLVVKTVSASAGASAMMAVRGPMMADAAFPPGGMATFHKFFGMLRDALAEQGAAAGELLAFTEARYARAVAEAEGARDIAAVFDSVQRSVPARSAALEGL